MFFKRKVVHPILTDMPWLWQVRPIWKPPQGEFYKVDVLRLSEARDLFRVLIPPSVFRYAKPAELRHHAHFCEDTIEEVVPFTPHQSEPDLYEAISAIKGNGTGHRSGLQHIVTSSEGSMAVFVFPETKSGGSAYIDLHNQAADLQKRS